MSATLSVTADGRALSLELEVPGSVEQVWRALATGPGITSWFVSSRVEEREGGAVAFEIAPGVESRGLVTAWEPPHRFAYEEPGWNGDAPPLATEFRIEELAGRSCRVRLVHRLATARDEWDESMAGFEAGWNAFFDLLRLYLRHFDGQPCGATRVMGRADQGEAEAWLAMRERLSLGAATPGGWAETGTGAPRLAGVVERLGGEFTPHEILLRLDEPAPGLALIGAYAWGGEVHPALSLYLYGEGSQVVLEREGPLWKAWMAKHFPAPTSAHGVDHA